MSFAACLRLSFSGFRVRSTAVFLGRLRRKCIRPQAVFLDYACEAPASAAASQSCTSAFHESGKDAGMFPQEGIFYAVFLHRGISARYDCHRPWSRSGRMGRDQPAGRLRQRQPRDTFVSEKLTHKVEGHVAQNFGELIFRWVK